MATFVDLSRRSIEDARVLLFAIVTAIVRHGSSLPMGNKPTGKLRREDCEFYRRNTRFSEVEIRDWFKAFHKDCPNGYLTLTDFQTIYAQYFPSGDSSNFAERVFRNFDRDGDQKVSFREFLLTLNVTARQSTKDKIEWAFGLYDTDQDGFISKQEMLEIVRSIYKMIGPAIRVSDDESTPEKRTNKIFHQFDRDRDERLSKEEFMQGTLTDPSIIQLLENEQTSAPAALANRLRT